MNEAITKEEGKVYSPHSALFGVMQSSRSSRCCVIAAHPNDEIVGGGCLISKLPNVQILHISNAAPRSGEEVLAAGFATVADYVEARKRECLSALELARVPAQRVFEFGMAQFKSPFQLVELSMRLLAFLQKISPQIVLTHAYEGGHPDHDATAFATHAAVRLLLESGLKPPVVFEMALYPGKNGNSKVPEFLQSPARESTTLMLDSKAQELKHRMFACFKTQQRILDDSPLGPERFRQAPGYDFLLPPHSGKLHYEHFDWGITGKQWRALASEAMEKLFGPRFASIRQRASQGNHKTFST
jgi:N-acetylglucosamine malate deacetylase 2